MLLINIDVDINNIEMPAVYVINKVFPEMEKLYGLIIIISMYTTATALGISLLNNYKKNGKINILLSFIICTSSVLFSTIGFSKMVNVMYPFLGVIGFWQIYKILIYRI